MSRFPRAAAAAAALILVSAGAWMLYARPAAAADDTAITASVKDRLAANAEANRSIVVQTRDGVVTLRGFAMTPTDVIRAIRDALSIPGVVKVDNRVVVQQ